MHPPKLVFYRSLITPTLRNLIGVFSVLMVSANSAAFSKVSDPFLDPFLLLRSGISCSPGLLLISPDTLLLLPSGVFLQVDL